MGLPATQWITVYNAHRPMKQRYHYNVANMRVEQHVVKGNDDGLFITSVACCQVRGRCGHVCLNADPRRRCVAPLDNVA